MPTDSLLTIADGGLPRRLTKQLPGPKAKKMMERDQAVMSPALIRDLPFVMSHGQGSVVEDVDGNRFLDLAAGIAVCTTGYQHPHVARAVHEQVDRCLHAGSTVFYEEGQVRLAEQLTQHVSIHHSKHNRIFFTNSGTEAIEGAIKLAKWRTKRPNLLSFVGGFHGRTYGSLSLNASKTIQKQGFEPLLPGVFHAFYPRPFKCPHNADYPTTPEACLSYLRDVLFKRVVAPETIAAMIIEPIQGEGGYVVGDSTFFTGLRNMCDEYGILLIADEVQAGVGRTGAFLAIEHTGVEPDMVCMAKGLASGLPLGAVVTSQAIMTWPQGAHSSTFAGNPVSCAAALATLDVLDAGLISHAASMGERLMQQLKPLVQTCPVVGDVRGRGLMIGIEIVDNKSTGVMPNAAMRDTIIDAAFERGLIVLGCGVSTIRLAPPLILSSAQVDFAAEQLTELLMHPPAQLSPQSSGRGSMVQKLLQRLKKLTH